MASELASPCATMTASSLGSNPCLGRLSNKVDAVDVAEGPGFVDAAEAVVELPPPPQEISRLAVNANARQRKLRVLVFTGQRISWCERVISTDRPQFSNGEPRW